MGHLKRHEAQGFDVCDHQHCQVYEGKKEPNEAIVKATAATSGIVLADTSFGPILAAYHANCGGQTANSQDVWVESRPYLVSVSDTFCLKERSATWVDSIAVADLKKFVGTEVDSLVTEGFRWTQSTRQSKLMVGNKVFKVADVRRNFKLKSAFFDMEVKGDVALFKGKGFGHGVGLCQQGAMKMAQKGFTFSEILGHYYSGVSLVNVSQLR
jgi:stage II sporulation protein D